MTTIYAYKTGDNGNRWGVHGVAVVEEDGNLLTVGGHCSSCIGYLKGDLGFLETAMGRLKREHYAKLYPEGFEVVWVDDPVNHPVIGKHYAEVSA